MNIILKVALIIAVCAFPPLQSNAQNNAIGVVKTFHIKSAGGWDYLALSPVNNSLYLSHGTQVNILDRTSGDSLGVIPQTTGVHGIAFAPEFKKGFISNGKLNNVFVFDINTNKVLDSIPTGTNPDFIYYDNYSKRLFLGNGKSENATVIDPSSNKVVATIALNGKPEAIVSNLHGQIYINLEDKHEIAVVNTRSMTVTKRYPLAVDEEPAGLAIDNITHRLFAGCSNKKMIVLNAITGSYIASVPIGDHCDGLSFDEVNRNILAANGDGTMTIVHQTGTSDTYKVIANVATKKGARTIAEDNKTHLAYLPTAEFEPQPAGFKERPKMIPGTFQVLVVGNK